MQGTLSEFTLAELLQLFALAERTGAIIVYRAGWSTAVFLESGKVVGIGNESFNVYGEIMACELLPARSGVGLDAVKPAPSSPGLSFIVKNVIEPERWDLFVQRCLEQEIYPLLTLEHGSFDVRVERIPPCPLTVSIPVQQLVLDGSRWEAEMTEYRLDGYDTTTLWSRAPRPDPIISMSSIDWLIWAILEEQLIIGDVARRLCIPDLDATAAVRRLQAYGLLSAAG
ncbi:hypothetical protein BH23CHL1_BH23CHL1_07430 [soil metagenome]